MNTIKNNSKIGYKAKQDNGNTEEHADLHMSRQESRCPMT